MRQLPEPLAYALGLDEPVLDGIYGFLYQDGGVGKLDGLAHNLSFPDSRQAACGLARTSALSRKRRLG